MNIQKMLTNGASVIQYQSQDITPKITDVAESDVHLVSLEGLSSLASYNLGNIKKLIKFGNLEIEPIKSEKEFNEVMNSLKNSRCKEAFRHCFSTENSPDKYMIALQGYWGEDDISQYINRYMATGKPMSKMPIKSYSLHQEKNLTQEDLYNYIRIMEYSLRKLDDVIPTFDGIVWRAGYFNKDGGQFFSSSKYAGGAVLHASGGTDSSPSFSVIKTKKGYDIEYINRNTRFAAEKEVLLAPNNKYVDITDQISKEELEGYYFEIISCIKKIIRENFGSENARKAEDFIGSLRVYSQI